MLSFEMLREQNVRRCEESHHDIDRWTPTDWACALAGEAGEACNEIKKLRRLVTPEWKLQTNNGGMEAEVVRLRIALELADLVTYADLCAARLGINLGAAIVAKFNEVSRRVGSGVTLGDPGEIIKQGVQYSEQL